MRLRWRRRARSCPPLPHRDDAGVAGPGSAALDRFDDRRAQPPFRANLTSSRASSPIGPRNGRRQVRAVRTNSARTSTNAVCYRACAPHASRRPVRPHPTPGAPRRTTRPSPRTSGVVLTISSAMCRRYPITPWPSRRRRRPVEIDRGGRRRYGGSRVRKLLPETASSAGSAPDRCAGPTTAEPMSSPERTSSADTVVSAPAGCSGGTLSSCGRGVARRRGEAQDRSCGRCSRR